MGFDAPSWFPTTELPAGTSLLIAGPSLTDKRRLMLDLCGGDEGAVLVTTKAGGERLLAEYGARQMTEHLRVVDCVSAERGFGDVEDTDVVSRLSSPRDLTGLSIATTGLFQDLHEAGYPTRFGLHSLSTLLMYHDLQRVYRMVHLLTGQVETAGWLGTFVVDAPTDREREILSQLVDGIVETREGENGRELRVRGLAGGTSGWQSY